MFFVHLCKQSSRLEDVLDFHSCCSEKNIYFRAVHTFYVKWAYRSSLHPFICLFFSHNLRYVILLQTDWLVDWLIDWLIDWRDCQRFHRTGSLDQNKECLTLKAERVQCLSEYLAHTWGTATKGVILFIAQHCLPAFTYGCITAISSDTLTYLLTYYLLTYSLSYLLTYSLTH